MSGEMSRLIATVTSLLKTDGWTLSGTSLNPPIVESWTRGDDMLSATYKFTDSLNREPQVRFKLYSR